MGAWQFTVIHSTKLQDELWEYMNNFPELIEYLFNQMSQSDRGEEQVQLKANDIWPDKENCKEQLQKLSKFRSELPCVQVLYTTL